MPTSEYWKAVDWDASVKALLTFGVEDSLGVKADLNGLWVEILESLRCASVDGSLPVLDDFVRRVLQSRAQAEAFHKAREGSSE